MNTEQRTALTSAIQILKTSGGHYSTRDTIYTLRCMLDNDDKKELRTVATMQQAIAIEVESMQACIERTNEDMQAIGKAAAAKHWRLAYKQSALTTGDTSSILTRVASKLSRLADGRK